MLSKPSDYLEAGLKLEFEEYLKHLFNSTAAIEMVSGGTIVLSQGQIPSSLYFVYKGILRGYYVDI